MAVENRHSLAMRRLQRPQPLLILHTQRAVHIGATLKQAEHQRHFRLWLQLAVEEIGVAGVQQPLSVARRRD